jgi:hypothetical protein
MGSAEGAGLGHDDDVEQLVMSNDDRLVSVGSKLSKISTAGELRRRITSKLSKNRPEKAPLVAKGADRVTRGLRGSVAAFVR